MYSYLRYLLLDSAISCGFERIEGLFVAPEYRKVPYDRYIRCPLNYDFFIRYQCPVHINTRSWYMWLDHDVYVSDTVSHIPPWGMLDL